jgi:hypothetical protein
MEGDRDGAMCIDHANVGAVKGHLRVVQLDKFN